MKAQSAANATVPLRGPSAFCICLFPQVGLCCMGYGRESRQVPTSRNISSYGFAVDTKSPQLKTAGTQKVFPLSPLRTPLTPSQKNKECYPSLGGTGGTLFAQHYSCPAVLRCSVGSTVAAFRELLSYGRIASVAQAPLVPALPQQGGSVEPPESFAYQDEPGTLSPCGAERTAESRTCATSSSPNSLR